MQPQQPYNQNINFRPIVLVVAIAVLLLLLWWVFSFFTGRGSIMIVSDPNATIEVATERGGVFTQKATGEYSYTSREEGEVIYVRATSGDEVMVTSATVIPGESQTISLLANQLTPPTPEKAFDGTVAYPFIAGDEAFGLTASGDLVNFGISDFIAPRSDFIGIPTLQKVIWETANQFAYTNTVIGVGAFDNGIDPFEQVGDAVVYRDVAKSQGRPYALLSDSAIWLANSISDTPRQIISPDIQDGIISLFAGSDNVYVADQPFPGEYADTPAEGEVGINPTTVIIPFSYNGGRGEQFEVTTSDVSAVFDEASTGSVVVFHERGFSLKPSDTNEVSAAPSYFIHNEQVVQLPTGPYIVLNELGLWSVDVQENIYRQLVALTENDEAAENSLLLQGDFLLYGATLGTEQVTYRIDLSQLE